jgi:hypothetical protein
MTIQKSGTEIDWKIPGVPINKGVFSDLRGKTLWIEEPYPFSRANALGEFLVQKSIHYIVRKVAYHEGVMYVNLEGGVQS